MESLNHEVLTGIEQQVLTPAVVRKAVRRAIELRKARAAKRIDQPEELRRVLAQLEAERGRLVAAIRIGSGALRALVDALAQREQRSEGLRCALAQLAPPRRGMS